MKRRLLLAAAIATAALSFFALGWLASRAFGPAPSAHDGKSHDEDLSDAGPLEPIMLIDAASIQLLPGKELRLDPPAPPEIETNPR